MNTQTRRIVTLLVAATLAWPAASMGDICGCTGSPDSLGDFDSLDPASWPPGSVQTNGVLEIPLPEDGILIFDSANFGNLPGGWTDVFAKSYLFVSSGTTRRNVPVTILVAGDFALGTNAALNLDGQNGGTGSQGDERGVGGAAGPGGFRGGDGAFLVADPAANTSGGYGFGPGGGAAGDPGLGGDGDGQGGVYTGSADLLPLVGGSGGGGGNSRTTETQCGGGGGGGGGGALRLAVNGTATFTGDISADGGNAGSNNNNEACSSSGGAGSGGAVRILADTIERLGTQADITATGGTASFAGGAAGGSYGSDGVIRLEAFTNNFPPTQTDPIAFVAGAPGPLTSPILQQVAITAVAGETVSARNNLPLDDRPQGAFGEIDVILQAPGLVTVNVSTAGVPAGTSVEVTAKERRGGALITSLAALDAGNCDAAGACTAATSLDLGAGTYVLEARATFQP